MIFANGLYAHARRNNARSLFLFVGFVVAFIAVVYATLPVLFILVPLIIDLGALFFGFNMRLKTQTEPALMFMFQRPEEFCLATAAVGLVVFVLAYWREMRIVSRAPGFAWVDRRVEKRLSDIVGNLAISVGLPMPRIGIIETPELNALAGGWGASSAFVVVTRGLLVNLNDRELSTVIAHELSHIRNNDIRLTTAAYTFAGLVGLASCLLLVKQWKLRHIALFLLIPPLLIIVLFGRVVVHASGALTRFCQSFIGVSREYVADAHAIDITKDPEALVSALLKIHGRSTLPHVHERLRAMLIASPMVAAGDFKTHPSVEDRIAAIQRHVGSAYAGLPAKLLGTRPSIQHSPVFGPVPARAAFGTRVDANIPSPMPHSLVQRKATAAIEPATPRKVSKGFIVFVVLAGVYGCQQISFNAVEGTLSQLGTVSTQPGPAAKR